MRGIFKHLRRYRGRVLIGLFALLLVDAGQLFVPLFIRNAVNQLTAGSSEALVRNALLIVAMAILVGIGRFFWRFFLLGASRRIRRDVRNQIYQHIVKLSAKFFYNNTTGDLMAHFTNDADAVMMACGFGVLACADFCIMMTFCIAAMISIHPMLTLYAFLPLPILTFIVIFFGRIIHNRFEAVQETFSLLMEKVRESLAGIRVIKSFTQEEGMSRDFAKTNQLFIDQNMSLVKISGLLDPMISTLSELSFLMVLFFGGLAVVHQEINIGDFVAFMLYLGLLTWPMMAVGMMVNMMQRGSASMKRIETILASIPEIKDVPGAKPFDGPGRIEYKDLTFAYLQGTNVLEHINISIEPGETLGVIGLTGSGKSTLVHLMVRLFEPQRDQLLIDGLPVHEYQLYDLRRQIALVPQDGFLFSTTIRDNLAYGKPEATQEEIERVAKLAGIYEEILDMPQQFNTLLGERGVSLSGGQKQRVAIARALLTDPKILILDDALSAVDAEKEEEILGNLRQIFQERTAIVIAHRISAVKDLDHIIVLDHSKLIEQGTHEELIHANGIYAHLYELQKAEEGVTL
ncbi:ABC transporter ATP-binding protein [Candidatus Acetothermia bacterium]|nr:ABC transporter ATP-binding protein [Candidatus Acetothermia bacterium]MBI3643302.1 ABC transporter ATP-binding protein [Candidatus Acetothermia bacterium]